MKEFPTISISIPNSTKPEETIEIPFGKTIAFPFKKNVAIEATGRHGNVTFEIKPTGKRRTLRGITASVFTREPTPENTRQVSLEPRILNHNSPDSSPQIQPKPSIARRITIFRNESLVISAKEPAIQFTFTQ